MGLEDLQLALEHMQSRWLAGDCMNMSWAAFSLFAGSKLSLIPAKMQDGKTGLQNKMVTGLAGRLQLHT